ncbi:phosphosugar-binding protein [Clostridia bacterium]|nr:phosphosugar-binding protein [Clostridia bacterium]
MDFFERTAQTLPRLNQTERALFDYVVKNMDKAKAMSIQKLAAERYLSTTTIFRFTQKLGFSGYSDFIKSLLVTAHRNSPTDVPPVVHSRAYSEEYLKNVAEAVRVMPMSKIERVRGVLARRPSVYIITDDNTADIGRYCEKLFLGLGLNTYFPEASYQVTAMLRQIADGDLLLALSYSGRDPAIIDTVERVFLDRRPFLLSITRADNNALQNMSDVNMYVFADEIQLRGIDLTSRVPMIMLVELIAYDAMVNLFTEK